MRLHFYWIETNWHRRGYAKNYNLVVDLEKKTYRTYVNSYYDYNLPEDIEVKKKKDILDYVEYLKYNDFTETKI